MDSKEGEEESTAGKGEGAQRRRRVGELGAAPQEGVQTWRSLSRQGVTANPTLERQPGSDPAAPTQPKPGLCLSLLARLA